MKAIFKIILFLIVAVTSLYAQTDLQVTKEGDIYVIGEVTNDNYVYIKVPKDNFILKKGGIVDYKSFVGEKVVLNDIKKNKRGQTIATLTLASGKRFFRSHKYIKVILNEAIKTGELLKV